jgi:hypothetical protein
VIFKILDQNPKMEVALGATLALRHMSSFYDAVRNRSFPEGELIIFDFSGISAVNTSYLKATVFWVFLCGQLFAAKNSIAFSPKDPTDARPYDLFVGARNVSSDVKVEIVEFFESRELPFLLAESMGDNDTIETGTIVGHLEPALRETFEVLVDIGRAHAPVLHAKNPGTKLTVTAWNNRLNELFERRLVRRFKNGRAIEYEPLAKRILWERRL